MAATRRAPQLTPGVIRLILINGAVMLLLATVFTAPRFFESLVLDPAGFTQRPWTVLTAMFVPANLLAFAFHSAMLALFGPTVERRMGSKRFLLYYLYCGIGAALLGLALGSVLELGALHGPAGAIYGLGLAYVFTRAPLELHTGPEGGISARSLFVTFVALDLALGLWAGDGLARLVPLGGILSGYLYYRMQSLTAREQPIRPVPPVRRPVVTPMRAQDVALERAQAVVPHTELPPEDSSAEVDRVLDKIAQSGIDSLSLHERRLLSEASERKRREQT
ncbi:MAG: rhomboid family intramembrane serine protease [Gemmatimonadales bacterium]